MEAFPITLPSAAGWSKIWGTQGERCPISVINFLICLTLLFGTETSGPHCQKEGSINLYCIESVDNDADALEIKFWAHRNNNVNWTAQKDFIQTCLLPESLLFKVTQKVPSFPSMSIFTCVGNDFI